MPISQSKYIAITSGIGGSAVASRKELILRVLTTNALAPAHTVLEFTSAANVATYFGANSREAQVANSYFGRISKSITQAGKISFYRYTLSAMAAFLRSGTIASLAQLTPITDGSITVNMGGVSAALSGLDFSSATSYADVAEVLQTAIQAYTTGGASFTAATVTFDSTNGLLLTNGTTGASSEISYASGDVAVLFGWTQGTGAVISQGSDAQAIADVLNDNVQISTNFATFAFLNTADVDVDAIGQFTAAQNMQYMGCVDCSADNYNDVITTAAKYDGVFVTLNPNYGDTTQLPAWLMPAILVATTNYDGINSVINFMYQQFADQSVAVDNDADAQKYDAVYVNYNGQTQKSGANISFLQDGFMANGVDGAIFSNEIWMKDAMQTGLFNLFLALEQLPANIAGQSLVTGICEGVIQQGKANGTISVGKDLTDTQKAFITQFTGDNEAWRQVSLNGAVLKVSITTEDNKYICTYVLVYSKGDSIRKVEGKHILI